MFYAMRHFTGHKIEYNKDRFWRDKGSFSEKMVYNYMKNYPYSTHPSPKTTGRELFRDDRVIELVKICTDAGLSPEGTVAMITGTTGQGHCGRIPHLGPKGQRRQA